MEESSYVLEMNHVTWDANALNAFVESSSNKWINTYDVMPCIKLSGYEPPVLEVIRQLVVDFHVSLEESYIVKLKPNTVLEKHSDFPRKASFNFPLTSSCSSSFVKFYIPDESLSESIHTHNIGSTPFIYNVRLNHSFHNPTDEDVILLNLSTFDDWDRVKEIIDSKRM